MGLPVPALRQLQRTALADEITTLYAHINSATCRLLELIADFDAQGLFVYFNALSTAHWLNWACGIGPAAAREKVRVARALGELPQLQAAFRAGTVSYSKVRALTRVASPANEGTLLDMARHATAAQIERIVRHYRTALCLEQPGSEPAASRSLSVAWDPDGCLVFKGRLSPDQGALFLKALERSVEDLENPEDARPVWERHRDYPLAARRADALVGLAEQGLAESGRGGSSAERFQVNVYVSAETLMSDKIHPAEGQTDRDGGAAGAPGSMESAGGRALTPDPAHLDDGPVIGPERARRLCCDGSVIPLLEAANGEILGIGRKTRTVPPALRRALKRRDRGCRFPGCGQTRWVDAHHIRHWAQGGETCLDNLVLLCRRHHACLHEGGYHIRRHHTGPSVRLEFVDPAGQTIPQTNDDLSAGNWETLIADVSAETPGLHAGTPIPDCDWRPPDYQHIAWWMVNYMAR